MKRKWLGQGIILSLDANGTSWVLADLERCIAEEERDYQIVDADGRVRHTVPKSKTVVVLLAQGNGYRCHSFRHLP